MPEQQNLRPWLSRLNDDQCAAVKVRGNACVLAGAGTGKTTTLVAAIADRILGDGMSPSSLVVTTFTKQAAKELSTRIEAMGCPVPPLTGTLHSIGYKMLWRYPELLQGRSKTWSVPKAYEISNFLMNDVFPQVIDEEVMRALMDDLDIDREKDARFNKIARQTMEMISAIKDVGFSPEDLARFEDDCREPSLDGQFLPPTLMNKAKNDPAAWRLSRLGYSLLDKHMRRFRLLDYDDILLLVTTGLERDQSLLRRITSDIRTVMVDEYQDLSLMQHRFASLLATQGDMIVVGDDGQSIYGWRNADVSGIRSQSAMPDVTTIRLRQNYRSTRSILVAGESMLSGDPKALPFRLEAAADHADAASVPTLTGDEAGDDEICGIAAEIVEKIAQGASPSSIAVLCRCNAHVSDLYYELTKRGVSAFSTQPLIWEKKETRFLMAVAALVAMKLGLINEPAANPDWHCQNTKRFRLVTDLNAGVLKFGLGPATIRDMRESLESVGLLATLDNEATRTTRLKPLMSAISRLADDYRTDPYPTMSKFIAAIARETGLSAFFHRKQKELEQTIRRRKAREAGSDQENLDLTRTQVQNIEALMMLADRTQTIPALLKFAYGEMRLVQVRRTNEADTPPSVLISSIHAAKGMEWDIVYLFGMTGHLMNHDVAPDSMEYGEGHRLGYVATTRARQELHISWAKNYGDDTIHGPCPALIDLPVEALERRGVLYIPKETPEKPPQIEAQTIET